MIKKISITVLILIGVFLRSYSIDNVPAGFFADEIAIAVNAKTIAENGMDEFGNKYPFGFESFSDYKLPGYIYLSSLFYFFLGSQVMTVRLPAVISSVLSIFLLGYLIYLLFPKNKTQIYFSMIILALCPFHIHFSRIAYETILSTSFFLVFQISLIKTIKNSKRMWYIIGVISLLLSVWTYHAVRFIIPVLLFSLLTTGLIFKKIDVEKKKIILSSLFFILISVISYIPFVLNPEIDKRPLGYVLSADGKSFLVTIFEKAVSVFSSWLSIWNFEYLFLKGDLFGYRHGTKEIGAFLSIFSIPLVLGIIYFIKHFSFRSFSMIFILLLIVISGLPSALTYSSAYGPRFLPMIIPLVILISFGLSKLTIYADKLRLNLKIIVYAAISIFLIYQISHYYHIYFTHFEEKSLPEFPDAPINAIRYAKSELSESTQNKLYFLNGKSCLPWGYDELKLWYFARLDNKEMVKWNNLFRQQRFATGNPFGSYDDLLRPTYSFKNIVIHPSHEEMARAPAGSILIRCGLHANDINREKEEIKLFYMYERQKREILYVVSKKK